MKLEVSQDVAAQPGATLPGRTPVMDSEGNRSGVSSDGRLSRFDALDQLYQDFCRRRDAGEPVDPDAYCARYPAMKSALGRLLQCQIFLEQNSTLFAEPREIHWPEIGETFHDYHLKLELGKGAFARVYLATEPKLGNRLVAVKVALHGGAEADVLGRIRHPNIVPVHSVQEDKPTGLTAVCMPYVGAATLHDVLDRAFAVARPARARVILEAASELPFPLDPSAHPCAPDPILRNGTYVDGVRLIGAQLAEALAYLHANGICHRDLKPSNVLLDPAGVPLLLDFNLCADAQAVQNRLGGTMPYMSPEQLRATEAKDSGAALDGRSDIFSLGVILYELATGTHPFGPAPLKLTSADLRRHLLERQKAGPVEARRLNPDVDAAFSRLIQRCLAVDPQDRPQSAAEVASALRGALAPLPRTKRLLARNPRKTLAVAIFLLAIGLGSIAFALARAPHSERQFDAGLRLYREGQYGQAVQHFNEVLQDDPHNHEARFVRARAHQQMGIEDKDRYNLAIQDYLEADRRNPDGRCKAALGYCLNRTSGRSEVAIEYYKQAIRLGFAPAETYNNLGFSYMLLGKLDDARHNLNLAIEVDSKLQAPYHNRARLAINQAQQINLRLEVRTTESEFYRILLSGIADAQKAIDLGPASAELYFDSARLRAMAARVDQKWIEPAMQHLEESLKVGCDPRKCNDATLQQLQTHPRFADLANRPAGRPFPPTRRLVDPIHDRAQ